MNFVKNIFYSLCEIIFCLSISITSILIPLNYIYGSFAIKLTFFQAILPSIFSIFTIPAIISSIALFKYGIFLKIPTLVSTFIFYLSSYRYKIYKILAPIFLTSCFLILILNNFGSKIWWYGSGWIISTLIIILSDAFEIDSIFLKSFVTVWAAHAIGTLFFIFYTENNLNVNNFVNLVPISWVERTILSICSTLIFNLSQFIKYKIYNIKYFELKEYKKN